MWVQIYKIQNTKYKIQNTKQKIQNKSIKWNRITNKNTNTDTNRRKYTEKVESISRARLRSLETCGYQLHAVSWARWEYIFFCLFFLFVLNICINLNLYIHWESLFVSIAVASRKKRKYSPRLSKTYQCTSNHQQTGMEASFLPLDPDTLTLLVTFSLSFDLGSQARSCIQVKV